MLKLGIWTHLCELRGVRRCPNWCHHLWERCEVTTTTTTSTSTSTSTRIGLVFAILNTWWANLGPAAQPRSARSKVQMRREDRFRSTPDLDKRSWRHRSAQLQKIARPGTDFFMSVVPNQRPGYRWSCSHSYLDQGQLQERMWCLHMFFFFGFNCWLKISIVTQPEHKENPNGMLLHENVWKPIFKGW